MISGEQQSGARQLEAEVVGGVPGRIDGLDDQLAALEPVAVKKQPVGDERRVVGLEPDGSPAGRGPEGQDRSPGDLLQPSGQRRVVDVRVRHENPAQPVTCGLQESGQVGVVVRAGVDEGQTIIAEQVGVRAGPRHDPRVRSNQTSHSGRHFDQLPGPQGLGPHREFGRLRERAVGSGSGDRVSHGTTLPLVRVAPEYGRTDGEVE